MKKISVVVPTYNEIENVRALRDAVAAVFAQRLPQYEYEMIFIDNCSADGTREELAALCAEDAHVKAILNAKNFGQFNSPYYGLLQSGGDATVLLAADFQDPVELIPQFVEEWEKGWRIVIGIKTASHENPLMYGLRSLYYRIIKRLSATEQIEHFTGFGLYDRAFVEVLRGLNDPSPFLRGVVAELGFPHKDIPYTQPARRAGKTSNNWYRLYDAAMLSFTSYTKIGLRLATLLGFGIAALSLLVGLVYLVLKLVFWERFTAGMTPLLIGIFFMGAVQLIFTGFLGEYIMSINTRVMRRPLVVEEKRIGWGEKEEAPRQE